MPIFGEPPSLMMVEQMCFTSIVVPPTFLDGDEEKVSRALAQGAAKKRAELAGLTGKAFDCRYAENELAYHQVVNKTVETGFIPAATVPELKALLADALVTFKQHQGHAAHMVAGLGCGS